MTQVVTAAPCNKCPFRKDVPVYLRAERRREIARSLIDGHDFWCHKTVEHIERDDGDYDVDDSKAVICAGAAKAIMLSGGTTNLMRVGERLGMVDLERTARRGSDVWDLDTWQRLAEGATKDDPKEEQSEGEPCSTVNDGCLAPAGFLGLGGGVIHGTEIADGECSLCGEPLCSNCADSEGRCSMCTEDED